jgi:LPS-assembly protein
MRLVGGCRLWLLAAAGLVLALSAPTADAQRLSIPTPPLKFAPQNQGLPVLLTADQVVYYRDLGVVTANGNVELSQGERVLLADTVTYNEKTDTSTANGHVSLLEPGGEVLFAEYMELTDSMREGFIRNVRALLSDNSRMAANAARRVDGTRNELARGVFSPCALCPNDPTRPPLWQIKAVKIVHDEEAHDITYEDAVMEMFGVPVAYTPYFSHPDPTVRQLSGFLLPRFAHGSDVGYIIGTPYYWAIAPDRDLTVEPVIYTAEGEMLIGEYRQRFANANLDLKGSAAYVNQREGGVKTGDKTVQANIDSTAHMDFDDTWRGGLQAQRASDRLYIERYRLGDPEILTSQAFVEGFRGRDYASVNAYAFQDLRDGIDRKTTPLVAPFAQYSFVGQPGQYGGRFSLDASALSLTRDIGADSNRLAATSGWTLPYTAPTGEVYSLSTFLYSDGYYVNDVANPAGAGSPTLDGLTGRVIPQLAFNWRYPWARNDGSIREVVEPVVQFVAATIGGNPAKIPNEDSTAFELDDSNLFRPNRFAGTDRVSSGQRLDYGANFTASGAAGGRGAFFFGQSYNLQRNAVYTPGSGASGNLTDYVGRLLVSPASYLDLVYRFRLNHNNLGFSRNEVGLSGGPDFLKAAITYVQTPSNTDLPTSSNIREISGAASLRLNQNWTTSGSIVRDLTAADTRAAAFRIAYADECFVFAVDYSRRFTTNGTLRPDSTLLFRLYFKYLGEVDTRGPTL